MTPQAAGLTYEQALTALADRGRFGVRLGLGRTRALLRELGNPEREVRGALVGGTNGKGSVLALADAALRAAGHHVGTTPKPHLVTYRERICVDGAPIAADDFARLVAESCRSPSASRGVTASPTEFELLTAVVFARFARGPARTSRSSRSVSAGGSTRRMPGTEAWPPSRTSTWTTWTASGDTVAAIAREKAAIIERGDLAVTGARGDGLAVIRRRARRIGAPLTIVDACAAARLGPRRHRGRPAAAWPDSGRPARPAPGGERRDRRRGPRRARDGRDRAGSAARLDGIGYASATWPGRLELLDVGGRDVLLDGAHNPAGAAALAAALDDLRPFLADGPLTLITASMADKDVDGVIAALIGAPAPTAGGRARDATVVVHQRARDGTRSQADELAGTLESDRRRGQPSRRSGARSAAPRSRPAGSRVAIAGRSARPGTRRRCGFALSCRHGARTSRGRPGAARPRARHARRHVRTRMTGITTSRTLAGPSPAPSRSVHGRSRWGERTFVMGILNVTPDSFSGDGLLAARPTTAVERGAVAQRCDRPADGRRRAPTCSTSAANPRGPATPRSTSTTELAASCRSSPRSGAALPDMPISVDTTKPAVAEAALDAGADLINDVWGVGADDRPGRGSPLQRGVPIVVMHNRAEPRLRRR